MSRIYSMTAFARQDSHSEHGEVSIELRSVNHRYLDCSFKMPDSLRALEPRLKALTGTKVSRGKVDCFIKLQPKLESGHEFKINTQLLDSLREATGVISALFDAAKPTTLEILEFPGVCTAPEQPGEALHAAVTEAFASGLQALVEARQREGEKLANLILERLELIAAQVTATRKSVPTLQQQLRNKVIARIEDIDASVDQGRLEQELVYLMQKSDVDEELDRLEAHVTEVRSTLRKGGPCGRRLDFLMQELNREANTLSSKSTASRTTQSSIELKVLIEQMREQVQNIE